MQIPEELKPFFILFIFVVLVGMWLFREPGVSLFLIGVIVLGTLYALISVIKRYNEDKAKDLEFVRRLEQELIKSSDKIKTLETFAENLSYQELHINTDASVSSEEQSRRWRLRSDYRRALKIVEDMLKKEKAKRPTQNR